MRWACLVVMASALAEKAEIHAPSAVTAATTCPACPMRAASYVAWRSQTAVRSACRRAEAARYRPTAVREGRAPCCREAFRERATWCLLRLHPRTAATPRRLDRIRAPRRPQARHPTQALPPTRARHPTLAQVSTP